MNRRWIAAGLSLAALAAAPISAFAVALPPQQITNDSIDQAWSTRATSLSRGKILWLESDMGAIDTVFLCDGAANPIQVLPPSFEKVETAVFHLGSGLAVGTVIAGWRRAPPGT